MIPAPNPVFSCIDKFAHGQCDAVRVDGKRCIREAVEHRTINGKRYLICRHHRQPGRFKPFGGSQ